MEKGGRYSSPCFRSELCDKLLHKQFIVGDSVGLLLGRLFLKGPVFEEACNQRQEQFLPLLVLQCADIWWQYLKCADSIERVWGWRLWPHEWVDWSSWSIRSRFFGDSSFRAVFFRNYLYWDRLRYFLKMGPVFHRRHMFKNLKGGGRGWKCDF